MRGRLVLLAITAVVAACGSGSSAATARSPSLTVTYWPNGTHAGTPMTWRLRCGPAGGTLPRPAAACRRLAEGGARLFAGVPQNVMCPQVYGGPQAARVVGWLAGRGSRRASAARTGASSSAGTASRPGSCRAAAWP